MNKAQAFKEWTEKHLAGQHNQKLHGTRGGASINPGNTGKISDLKRMIDNPQELMNFISSKIGDEYFTGSVGLRGLYRNEKAGNIKPSSVWDDGKRKREKLEGTSAVQVARSWADDPPSVTANSIKRLASSVFSYGDGRVGLVIGDAGNYGGDYGELVIPNAKVIYIWEP